MGSNEDIEKKKALRLKFYRKAGNVARSALEMGADLIKEGANILQVTNRVEEYIHEKGCKPAFPTNIAINEVAAHFTPRHDDTDLVFHRGDLVKLDVGAHYKGFIGDTAMTVEVGTNNWSDLKRASIEALRTVIDIIRPGMELSKIGEAVEQTIKGYGFKPIRNLTGHGLRRYKLHGSPSVPNVPDRNKGMIQEGRFVAVEPFATNGLGEVDGKKNSNIYSFVRKRSFITSREAGAMQKRIMDRFQKLPFAERWCSEMTKNPQKTLSVLSRSGAITYYPVLKEIDDGMVSQAEHTLHVTSDGCEILTQA